MADHLIARARAKVLNNHINGRKPEVKVMIGRDIYINVRWKGNEVLEDMVKLSKKKNKKSELPCASADTCGRSVRFIVDTGCGHDLISQRQVKELGLETFLDNDGMTFMTANGLTDSNEITVMDSWSMKVWDNVNYMFSTKRQLFFRLEVGAPKRVIPSCGQKVRTSSLL